MGHDPNIYTSFSNLVYPTYKSLTIDHSLGEDWKTANHTFIKGEEVTANEIYRYLQAENMIIVKLGSNSIKCNSLIDVDVNSNKDYQIPKMVQI